MNANGRGVFILSNIETITLQDVGGSGNYWAAISIHHPGNSNLGYGPYGKPILSDGCNDGLHFNLAHSDGMALAGMTRVGPLGLDIERIQVLEDMSELVKLFFSGRENSIFQKLGLEQRLFAFLQFVDSQRSIFKSNRRRHLPILEPGRSDLSAWRASVFS